MHNWINRVFTEQYTETLTSINILMFCNRLQMTQVTDHCAANILCASAIHFSTDIKLALRWLRNSVKFKTPGLLIEVTYMQAACSFLSIAPSYVFSEPNGKHIIQHGWGYDAIYLNIMQLLGQIWNMNENEICYYITLASLTVAQTDSRTYSLLTGLKSVHLPASFSSPPSHTKCLW